MHKNGISYINLRPNDVIIQKDGYIKISEIKFNILFKLKSNCEINKETCEYLSPEILNSKENTKDADWWTLGIIMYELIYSFPPFCGESDNKIKELIEKFELKFPKDDTINKNAKDLINKLLNKNPEKRLGHMKGFEEIKNHEFFKGFNFDDLENKNKLIKNYDTNKKYIDSKVISNTKLSEDEINIIRECSSKETEKQFRDIDNKKLI